MRKYQQLVLLLVSCFSVGILLMYKSENNRLKDVLKYVNFFGRNDAAVLRRIHNNTTSEDEEHQSKWAFTKPLPVWQLIGDSFYAYSAFWNQKELVAGGEAHVIVVGKKGAVVDFRCSLDVGGRNVQGKFRFQRDASEGVLDDEGTTFTNYHFFCQVSRNFGKPQYVLFSDTTSSIKRKVKLRLRHLKAGAVSAKSKSDGKGTTGVSAISAQPRHHLPATICVDLVSFDMRSRFARDADAMLQFFLLHQALGVEHFLIYNYDDLPESVMRMLAPTTMHVYGIPFNFPFLQTNTTATRIRQLLLTDCLLRNFNHASYTMLLAPNELVYPSARFAGKLTKGALLKQQLRVYSTETARFELATFAVCFDDRKKLLMDNVQYDPELKLNKLILYRLELPAAQLLLPTATSIELPLSKGFAHRYVDCQKVGADGLHDWRNSVRQELMQHVNELRNELDLLI